MQRLSLDGDEQQGVTLIDLSDEPTFPQPKRRRALEGELHVSHNSIQAVDMEKMKGYADIKQALSAESDVQANNVKALTNKIKELESVIAAMEAPFKKIATMPGVSATQSQMYEAIAPKLGAWGLLRDSSAPVDTTSVAAKSAPASLKATSPTVPPPSKGIMASTPIKAVSPPSNLTVRTENEPPVDTRPKPTVIVQPPIALTASNAVVAAPPTHESASGSVMLQAKLENLRRLFNMSSPSTERRAPLDHAKLRLETQAEVEQRRQASMATASYDQIQSPPNEVTLPYRPSPKKATDNVNAGKTADFVSKWGENKPSPFASEFKPFQPVQNAAATGFGILAERYIPVNQATDSYMARSKHAAEGATLGNGLNLLSSKYSATSEETESHPGSEKVAATRGWNPQPRFL